MELLIVEAIAGLVALVFGIRFLIGRRFIVKRDEAGRLGTTGSKGSRDVLIPEVLRRDEVIRAAFEKSVARIGQVTKSAAVPQIIKAEAGRIVEICRKRHYKASTEAIAALTEMLRAQVALRVADDDVANIQKSLEIRAEERDAALKQAQAQSRAVEREERRGEIEVEHLEVDLKLKKLELAERRNRSKQGEKRRGFNDYGPDE